MSPIDGPITDEELEEVRSKTFHRVTCLFQPWRAGVDCSCDCSCGALERLDSVISALRASQAEVVRLRESEAEYEELCNRLSQLLTETAEALKGPPPPNVWHDWSDLPGVALLLKADRDSWRVLADLTRQRAESFRVDL